MILKPINIFPDGHTLTALESITIAWENKGDQMVAFQISVQRNSDGVEVFSSGKIFNFTPMYTIPSGSLTNGIEYRFTITVFNTIDESATSDFKIIKCSSRPTVSIISDGYIRNQIATVSATYSQAENVKIKCYKFRLYDEFNNLLEESNYIYNEDLMYTFNFLLIDDTTYKIECVAVSQDDLEGTSVLVSVVADYISPYVSVKLKAETFPNKPFVKLSWDIIRIIGVAFGSTSFIDGEKLDTLNGKVYFDEGFNLSSDFTINIWLENPIENVDLIELLGTSCRIVIKYYDDKFHVFKYFGNITTHIVSNNLGTINSSNAILIQLQQVKRFLNIYSEVV